jgi:hypothetical protein
MKPSGGGRGRVSVGALGSAGAAVIERGVVGLGGEEAESGGTPGGAVGESVPAGSLFLPTTRIIQLTLFLSAHHESRA